MRGPGEESSTRVAANRRKTVVVLVVSALLLGLAFAWAAVVGRDRPSPPELAAREFYAAVLAGDCDLAEALLTESRRRAADRGDPLCVDGAGTTGKVVGARTERSGSGWAIVVVRADVNAVGDRESVLGVGLRYDSTGGRWQVDTVNPPCLDTGQREPGDVCERWGSL